MDDWDTVAQDFCIELKIKEFGLGIDYTVEKSYFSMFMWIMDWHEPNDSQQNGIYHEWITEIDMRSEDQRQKSIWGLLITPCSHDSS